MDGDEPMSAIMHSNNGTASKIIVDMADVKTTDKPVGKLCTNVLGACGAIAIYDAEHHVGGLLHYLLPEARINPQRALANPYMFADTGIPMLFRRAYKLGAVKECIAVKLIGGCNVMDPDNSFNIGYRNQAVAEDVLSRNGVAIAGKYLGCLEGMVVQLHMENGRVNVALPSGEEIEI
jgi:chemotaxis protein CheD